MADLVNSSSVSVLSGNALAMNVFTPIGTQGAPVTYDIAGGADASKFTLIQGPAGAAAELRFITPPDISNPQDVGSDNVYDVVVNASAAGQVVSTAYHLRVVADDHLGSVATTSIIVPGGGFVTGRIDIFEDKDWFRFESSGQGHQVATFGASQFAFYGPDGSMRLSYSGGDVNIQHVELPAGVYYFSITGAVAGAEYRAMIAPGPQMNFPTSGDDVRTGAEQSDFLAGNQGNDTLVGNAGNDFLLGGLDNDSLDGGSGLNYLRGEDGNDTILGGANFDDIHGNTGDDSVAGGDGDDWVVGGQGNDFVSGGAGQDLVHGSRGDDIVYGGVGADSMRGGQDNDVLYGEAGDDFLSGDRGDDTITGGTGADTFHTFDGAGIDRVLDFSIAEGDRVMLETPGTAYTAAQVGGDTVVEISGWTKLTLVGVQLATLPDGWIS